MEAGRDLDVRAGCPNAIERIEGGLLSYGNDMTREKPRPMNAGWAGSATPRRPSAASGATRFCAWPRRGRSSRSAPSRSRRALPPPCDRSWPLVAGKKPVGIVTSAAPIAGFRLRRRDRDGTHDPLGRGPPNSWCRRRMACFRRWCMRNSGTRNRMLWRDLHARRNKGRPAWLFAHWWWKRKNRARNRPASRRSRTTGCPRVT